MVYLTRASGFVALVATGFALVGCPSRSNPLPQPVSPPLVTTATTMWPDSSASELRRGYIGVLNNCDCCHGYPLPTEVGLAEWPDTLAQMIKRTRLESDEAQAVTRYLLAQAQLAQVSTPAP